MASVSALEAPALKPARPRALVYMRAWAPRLGTCHDTGSPSAAAALRLAGRYAEYPSPSVPTMINCVAPNTSNYLFLPNNRMYELVSTAATWTNAQAGCAAAPRNGWLATWWAPLPCCARERLGCHHTTIAARRAFLAAEPCLALMMQALADRAVRRRKPLLRAVEQLKHADAVLDRPEGAGRQQRQLVHVSGGAGCSAPALLLERAAPRLRWPAPPDAAIGRALMQPATASALAAG